MIELPPERMAAEAGAEIVGTPAGDGAAGRPARAVIDSREAAHEDLFFGLPGAQVDGGRFAAQALEQGAWGVVVTPERASELTAAGARSGMGDGCARPVARPAVAGPRLAT